MLCKGLDLQKSLKLPKYMLFLKSVLAFYSIRAVTTAAQNQKCLTLKTKQRNSLPAYRGDSSGYLVPALCMSANSWYSGLALSVGMRSKSLTV